MNNNSNTYKKSAKELIKRVLPKYYDRFIIEVIDKEKNDVFEIESDGGMIILRGNNGVSIGSALNWYLKFYCNCHISWCGSRIEIPNKLPNVPKKIRKETPNKYRYYFNYCTFNYSMSWWDWERWEKEIDWMALNGINMPLAITGHEYLWIKIGERLNISKDKIKEFLTGPAFFAWNYMGNVDGIGGPLPDSWIMEHYELQKKILKRQHELCIKSVLPGFYGHVPKALKEKYKEANITQLKSWFGVDGIYYLDSQDKLFNKIADIFYEEQEKLYGTDHFYSMDLFHEGSSPDNSEEYMKNAALGVYNKMIDNDEQGIWVMQSWSMREFIVKALPKEHLIMLDLYAEHNPQWKKTDAFYGRPWIWCMLHNFGGRNGLAGNLSKAYNNLYEAYNSKSKGDMVGVGIAPEAIEENPVFYDLVSEMIWNNSCFDIEVWVNNYLKRRYGKDNQNAQNAWKQLLKSVYSGVNSFGSTDSIICARPALEINKVVVSGVEPYFNLEDVLKAWKFMISCSQEFLDVEPYQYDLVDIGREVLAMYARPVYLKMIEAYNNKNKENFIEHWNVLKEIIVDLDELVSTNKMFLMGKWIEDAKNWSRHEQELSYYEYNARMQVTQWWPEVSFHDYAHKHWAGLLKEFYLPRWELFSKYLLECMDKDIELNYSKFEKDVIEFETNWIENSNILNSKPVGNAIEVSNKLFNKYYKVFNSNKYNI